MKVEEYVGERSLEKMKKTKWYALYSFLEELLYNGRVKEIPTEYGGKTKQFIGCEKVYVGSKVPPGVHILGHDGSNIETEKGLRELANECLRMAVKEVT